MVRFSDYDPVTMKGARPSGLRGRFGLEEITQKVDQV